MTTPSSDFALLTRLEIGDEEAIGLLFDAHSSIVYTIALQILGHMESAELVLHETFMTLWREPGSFIMRNDSLQSSFAVCAYKGALKLREKHRRLRLTCMCAWEETVESVYDSHSH
jgi:RNA polymerase sigma-70 factor (ECF subfamily)